MEKPTEEQLNNRYEAVPEETRDLWYRSGGIIAALADEYKLTGTQTEALVKVGELVVLGFVRKQQFPEALKTELNIAEEVAHGLAKDVHELIFSHIQKAPAQEVTTQSSDAAQFTPEHERGSEKENMETDPYREPIE